MPSVVLAGFFALILGFVVSVIVGIVAIVVLAKGKKESANKWAILRKTLMVVGIAILCGCGTFFAVANPLMSSYYPPTPRWEPKTEDVVGTWYLTERSEKIIEEDNYPISTHEIEFKQNGTFELINYPSFRYDLDDLSPQWEFMSGAGTWHIEKDVNNDWVIAIELNERQKHNYVGTYLLLSEKKPPYTIYDWVGDADSGITIAFTRE